MSELQAVTLEQAVLCLDCHTISNSETLCQVCQGSALMLIADKLGTIQPPTARMVTVVSEHAPLHNRFGRFTQKTLAYLDLVSPGSRPTLGKATAPVLPARR